LHLHDGFQEFPVWNDDELLDNRAVAYTTLLVRSSQAAVVHFSRIGSPSGPLWDVFM